MRILSVALLAVLGTSVSLPPASAASPSCETANFAAKLGNGTFVTVDVTNRIERFHLAAPGQRLGSAPISGLAPGEDILGVDFRPATGQLYGLGSTSRLYVINPITGVASAVGVAFTPALSGLSFGFDFNPTVDRIRVVSDAEQNLRLNPDTGQVSGSDGAINPAGNLAGSAYTNSFAGATSTTLFGLDSTSNELLIQSPPNDGTVTLVGPLGVDFDGNAGFDIAAGSNIGYAALFAGALPSNLYTIDLTTGAASLVGAIASTNAVRSMAVAAGPETVFGVSTSNKLSCFSNHAPGSLFATLQITGLQSGENVLAIDFRPATGELYGLGSTSRIYRIDIANGVASAVGAGPFAPALSGTDFGFDFNPTVDRIRLVSDAEQNLRLHPDLGTVAGTDTNLTPAGNVVAAAYTNSFAGATSTALFDIDSDTDLLLLQPTPNNGVLTAVGPLGVDASGLTGLDIAPRNTAFASITPPAGVATNLYTVNLVTGAATLVGTIGGGEVIRDTAVRLHTEVAYGLTAAAGPINRLIRFNPATPGVVVSNIAISGLQAGESILGIDFRPMTGELYGLGSTSRLYTIALTTGAATQVGPGPFASVLNGSNFGFDFNPTVDRIRVVSDTEQNIRLNPSTGTTAAVDIALNPAGDIVAAAYINNFSGATGTTLFDIDWVAGTLLIQSPPNNGTLMLVGTNLGITISNANVGFDIASSGEAYLSAYTGGVSPGLFRVNLATGTATLIGNVNTADTLVDFSIRLEVPAQIFADGFEN